MVTFSIPGDNELAEAGKSTPRPRPALPFARRGYVSTPLKNSRLGVPQSAPSRRMLTTRDEQPTSSLNRSTISTARNIFRASTTDSPSMTPFSPSIPQNTPKKVFAPGATPEPNRVFRESTAQATPRGMAAKTTSKDLFHMHPQDWNNKGSIYADQFLSHLCPTEFDDEQRRQFFCILDLRRLKYAANEIFSQKDWKLNVINFAKEFEKSRSIILLRYGLYEFQNVKPSKDVLKRWRREHGLPEPEEDNDEPTPTKVTAAKKRKADDEDTDMKDSSTNSKRRAPEHEEDVQEQQAPAPAPVPVPTSTLGKNKRRSSISDEADSQPSKMQKGQASALSLKPSAKPAEDNAAAKPNPFAFNKTNGSGSSLARSIFQNPKPTSTAGASGGNIFGYLSDASSAKNSGVDADAESEADSDAEDDSQGDEPSAAASGAETVSQVGNGCLSFGKATSAPTSSLFANKPATISNLFGAAKPAEKTSTPSDHADKTGGDESDKENDEAPKKSMFESKASAAQPSFGSMFSKPATEAVKAPEPAKPVTSLFGAKPDDKASTPAPTANLFGAVSKPAESSGPVLQSSTLFGAKPTGDDKPAATEAPKTSLFGAPSTSAANGESTTATSLFGAKPTTTASNLFGNTSTPAAAPLFGAPSSSDATAAKKDTPATTSMFSFGGASNGADKINGAAKPLFGAPQSPKPSSGIAGLDGSPMKQDEPSPAKRAFNGGTVSGASAPIFSFGGSTTPLPPLPLSAVVLQAPLHLCLVVPPRLLLLMT
ncbi:hypothetical protein SNK05_003379 [Fusarium graminearum]